MARLHFLGSSLLGAAGSAMVPISALLLLSREDYGAFSVPYLIFALGWSIMLSAVCDTWARRRTLDPDRQAWERYSGALLMGACFMSLVALGVSVAVLGSLGDAVAAAAGAGANIYRLGARYFHSASRGPQTVLASDLVGVVAFFLTVAAALNLHIGPLSGVLIGWALASIVSSLLFFPPRLNRGSGLIAWVRQRRATILPLLGESLLMDLGSIGAPLAMAPFLGSGNFGAYRSIASASVPIQLMLDPIRPNIAQMRPATVISRKVLVLVLGVATLVAAACFVVLTVLLPQLHFVGGALATLADYAVPCTIYVAVACIGHFYYIVSRGVLAHGALVKGRALQTVLHIVLPFSGLLLNGLDGAVWGFVAANASAAPVWPALLIRQRGRFLDQDARTGSVAGRSGYRCRQTPR